MSSVYFQNTSRIFYGWSCVFTAIILLSLAPTDAFSVNEQFTSKLHKVVIQTGTKLVIVCFHGILQLEYLYGSVPPKVIAILGLPTWNGQH